MIIVIVMPYYVQQYKILKYFIDDVCQVGNGTLCYDNETTTNSLLGIKPRGNF